MTDERSDDLLHIILARSNQVLAVHFLRCLSSADHHGRIQALAFRVRHPEHVRALHGIPADVDETNVTQAVNRKYNVILLHEKLVLREEIMHGFVEHALFDDLITVLLLELLRALLACTLRRPQRKRDDCSEKYKMPIRRGMVIDNAERIQALNDNAFVFPVSLLGV